MFKRTIIVVSIVALVAATIAAASVAYRYRSHLIEANAANRASLALAQQETAEARSAVNEWREWAPGLVSALKLKKQGISPNTGAQSYSSTGPYLGYNKRAEPIDPARVQLDEAGMPMVLRHGVPFYTPVSLAQFALAEYSREGGPTAQFLPAAEKLLSLEGPDGAFRYQFPFTKYATREAYEPGWVSGMAQGQALSVFARAYATTKDPRYLDAGKRALDFMLLPFESGGTRTTLKYLLPEPSDAVFIMEYPQDPPVFTLNGFMFAMLGLYDWASVTGDDEARHYAEETTKTLKIILPYYDMGIISAYDLSFITIPLMPDGTRRTPHVGLFYHKVHIELLWALHHITGDPMFQEVADRWLSYIDGPAPSRCSDETEAAINAILDLDPNAPGLEIVGDQLAALVAQCEKERHGN